MLILRGLMRKGTPKQSKPNGPNEEAPDVKGRTPRTYEIRTGNKTDARRLHTTFTHCLPPWVPGFAVQYIREGTEVGVTLRDTILSNVEVERIIEKTEAHKSYDIQEVGPELIRLREQIERERAQRSTTEQKLGEERRRAQQLSAEIEKDKKALTSLVEEEAKRTQNFVPTQDALYAALKTLAGCTGTEIPSRKILDEPSRAQDYIAQQAEDLHRQREAPISSVKDGEERRERVRRGKLHLKAWIGSLVDQNESYSHLVAELQAREAEKEGRIRSLEVDVDTKADRIRELNTTECRQKHTLRSLESQLRTAEATLEDLKRTYANTVPVGKYESIERELRETKDNFRRAEKQREELMEASNALEARVAEFEKQLEEKEGMYTELDNRFASLAEKAAKEEARLTTQVSSLQEQIKQSLRAEDVIVPDPDAEFLLIHMGYLCGIYGSAQIDKSVVPFFEAHDIQPLKRKTAGGTRVYPFGSIAEKLDLFVKSMEPLSESQGEDEKDTKKARLKQRILRYFTAEPDPEWSPELWDDDKRVTSRELALAYRKSLSGISSIIKKEAPDARPIETENKLERAIGGERHYQTRLAVYRWGDIKEAFKGKLRETDDFSPGKPWEMIKLKKPLLIKENRYARLQSQLDIAREEFLAIQIKLQEAENKLAADRETAKTKYDQIYQEKTALEQQVAGLHKIDEQYQRLVQEKKQLELDLAKAIAERQPKFEDIKQRYEGEVARRKELERLVDDAQKQLDLGPEDILFKAFKANLGPSLNQAIQRYNAAFEEGIPDELDLALRPFEEYVQEELGERLHAYDASLKMRPGSIDPLRRKLRDEAIPFEETAYWREHNKQYKLAKLVADGSASKKEAELMPEEQDARQIVGEFNAIKDAHESKRSIAADLLNQLDCLSGKYQEAIDRTKEFREQKLPLKVTFGSWAYHSKEGDTTILRFLVPTTEQNYTEPASVEFIFALGQAIGRSAYCTGVSARKYERNGCQAIDLIYPGEIGTRVRDIITDVTTQFDQTPFGRLGAKISIQNWGEMKKP